MAKDEAKKPAKKGGKGKKMSPYNAFMKAELAKLKTEQPDTPHNERFKIVAQKWKTSPLNPKNAS